MKTSEAILSGREGVKFTDVTRTKSGNDDDDETRVQFLGVLARTRRGLVSGTARRITSVLFLLLATIKRFPPSLSFLLETGVFVPGLASDSSTPRPFTAALFYNGALSGRRYYCNLS